MYIEFKLWRTKQNTGGMMKYQSGKNKKCHAKLNGKSIGWMGLDLRRWSRAFSKSGWKWRRRNQMTSARQRHRWHGGDTLWWHNNMSCIHPIPSHQIPPFHVRFARSKETWTLDLKIDNTLKVNSKPVTHTRHQVVPKCLVQYLSR